MKGPRELAGFCVEGADVTGRIFLVGQAVAYAVA
jgi:hypothetical protein